MGDDTIHGEGNYKAAKAYNDDASATADDKVNAAAIKAKQALASGEGTALEQAEAEDKSHANS